MVVNPGVRLVRSGRNPDHQNIPARFGVPHPRQQRNDRRLDLHAARLGHPLLDSRAPGSRNAPVVLDTHQDRSALQVEESHQFLGETLDHRAVPLELQGRTLALVDEFDQFVSVHFDPPATPAHNNFSRCRRAGSLFISVNATPPRSGVNSYGSACPNGNSQRFEATTSWTGEPASFRTCWDSDCHTVLGT